MDKKAYGRRIIMIASILCAVCGIIYVISPAIGSDLEDFCSAALPWVLGGIVIASFLAYIANRDEKGEDRDDRK